MCMYAVYASLYASVCACVYGYAYDWRVFLRAHVNRCMSVDTRVSFVPDLHRLSDKSFPHGEQADAEHVRKRRWQLQA